MIYPSIKYRDIELSGVWENKKTKDTYIVKGLHINSTNAQNGQVMVQYTPNSFSELIVKELTNQDIRSYVREITEFLEKFEMVKE